LKYCVVYIYERNSEDIDLSDEEDDEIKNENLIGDCIVKGRSTIFSIIKKVNSIV
jgi:hypothetical protein